MARTCVIATCLLVVFGGLGSAAQGKERRATLRVVNLQPVTLAGSRFVAAEAVRVTVTAQGSTERRSVRATSRGTFVVRFETLSVDRCNGGLTARALGARGSFASTKVLPLPLCPPSLREPQ